MAKSTSANKAASLLTDRERAIIQEAARAAFAAGLVQSTERSKTAYKDTEQRLYNLPVLKLKIEDDRERLTELETKGSPMRSASLVRFKRSGSRIKPEDMLDALIQDIRASIAATEYEIATMEKALALIEGDQYAKIIPCLYFDDMTVMEVGDIIPCDKSTVFRQRGRLVQRLAVFLYGVDAT